MTTAVTDRALRRLLDAGRAVVSELDLEAVLQRVLETAADVTGARYAALGVLDETREGLERFLTHGVSDERRALIGAPPRGHGLLGAVIADPRPLRIDQMSAGKLPAGHPPMSSFLGVPILIRGDAWGNLYLCDKQDGEPFTDADEETLVVLAEWAGVAVENARLYARSERRRHELEATTEIARALGGETDLERILALIVERALDLLGARGVAIVLPDGDVVAGEPPGERPDAVVPLVFRGRTLGELVAVGGDGGDRALLQAVAASAATAVATARSVEEQRLRDAVRSAEEERRRWARELHDSTLQGLGGLRMLLVAGSRGGATLEDTVRNAISGLEEEIAGLRGLIRELRPAALDELGLAAALEGLAARAEAVDVCVEVGRLDPELETAVYRIAQEATGNAVRHAGARRIAIDVCSDDEVLVLRVRDDGRGFDPGAPSDGFGLIGMRERVALLRGELEIASSDAGTTITARFPV